MHKSHVMRLVFIYMCDKEIKTNLFSIQIGFCDIINNLNIYMQTLQLWFCMYIFKLLII